MLEAAGGQWSSSNGLATTTTSKKTQHFTITTINWLTLFKETIAVYCENSKKPINTLREKNAESLVVKAGGIYSYHLVLKG
jgi:hypothetical protein